MRVLDAYARTFPRPTDRLVLPFVKKYKNILTEIVSNVATDIEYDHVLEVKSHNVRHKVVLDKNGDPQVIVRLKSDDKPRLEELKHYLRFFEVYNYLIDRIMDTLSYGTRMRGTMGDEAYAQWKSVVKESVKNHVGILYYLIREQKEERLDLEKLNVIKNLDEQSYFTFVLRNGAYADSEEINGFYRYVQMIYDLHDQVALEHTA